MLVVLGLLKVGDIVRVNGSTFFSGLAYSENPSLDMSRYTPLFNRVGVVQAVSEVGTVTIKYLDSDSTSDFAPYQLEKLDNISPE